jgi:hypothetical protein
MLGAASLLFGLSGTVSYAMRELIMALVCLSVGFSAVLLLLAFCYLVFHGAARILSWVRMQSQQSNRATGEWVFAFSQPRRAIAKPSPTVP